MPSKVTIKSLIEQRLGKKFPDFMIYSVLEWIIFILLMVAGFLAFISDIFAELCELKIPCLLCTRTDQILAHRNPDFYYNNSICEAHKDPSSLGYCHVHKKLSDIRNMCEACLHSFAAAKECSGCDKNRPGTGVAHDTFDGFAGDARKLSMNRLKKDEIEQSKDSSEIRHCSCCGETLKPEKFKRSLSTKSPAPSPRAPVLARKYSKLNPISESELEELLEPGVANNEDSTGDRREDPANLEASLLPLLLAYDEKNTNPSRHPSFARVQKFFGTDSPNGTPRLGSRKLSIDKVGFNLDPDDVSSLSSKSLMALYMELEEERSAAAVAANNAMAMITRLQAEKASVHMEALQYRRMMEEQAMYDQEAMRVMNETLMRREEDVKSLEYELESYKEKYGHVKNTGGEICEVDVDDYHELKSRSFSSYSEKSGCCSPSGGDQDEHEGINGDEMSLDFEKERSFLWTLLTDLETKLHSPSDEASNSSENEADGNRENGRKDRLTREVSLIRERLRAVEAESGFLMHASMTLQRGNEGTKLLNEIAQHLRKLRFCDNSATEDTNEGVNFATEDTNEGVNSATEDTNEGVNFATEDTDEDVNSATEDTNEGVNSATEDTNDGIDKP